MDRHDPKRAAIDSMDERAEAAMEQGMIEITPGLFASQEQMEALARMYANQSNLKRAVEAMGQLPSGIRGSVFRLCTLVAKGRAVAEDVLMELKLRPERDEEGVVYSLVNIETHREVMSDAIERLSSIPDKLPAPKRHSDITELKSTPPPPILAEREQDSGNTEEERVEASQEILAHETRSFLGFTLKAEELANDTVYTLIGRALKAEEAFREMRDELVELVERFGPVEKEIELELREKLQLGKRIESLRKLHRYTVRAFEEARGYLNSFHGPIAEKLKELLHLHDFKMLEASLTHLEARLSATASDNRATIVPVSDIRDLKGDDEDSERE